MVDNQFKLSEKTVILSGQLNGLFQSTANQLSELGADVALITPNQDETQRFVNNMMELREVHSSRGRAAALGSELKTPDEAKDVVSRSAELFGGVDILVDMNFARFTPAFSDPKAIDQFFQDLNHSLVKSVYLSHSIMQFLVGRNKGRMIFVLNDGSQCPQQGVALHALYRSGLREFVKHLALEGIEKQINVNCVSAGLTEHYVQSRRPGTTSIRATAQELGEKLPHAKITDSLEIANTICFLASHLSSGITGQTLNVSHGL